MLEKLHDYRNSAKAVHSILEGSSEEIALQQAYASIRSDNRLQGCDLTTYLAAGKQGAKTYIDTIKNGKFLKIEVTASDPRDPLYPAWETLFNAGKTLSISPIPTTEDSYSSSPGFYEFASHTSDDASYISSSPTLVAPRSQQIMGVSTNVDAEVARLNDVVQAEAQSILNLTELLKGRNLPESPSPLQGRVEDLQEKLQQSLSNEEALQARLTELEDLLESKKDEFDSLQTLYTNSSAQSNALTAENRELLERTAQLNKQIEEYGEGLRILASSINTIKKEKQELANQSASYEKQLNETRALIQNKKDEFETLQALYADSNAKSSDLTAENRQLSEQAKKLNNQIQEYEAALLRLSSSINTIKKEKQELNDQVQEYGAALIRLSRSKEESENEKQELKDEIARQKQELASKSESYEKELNETTVLLEKLLAEKTRLEKKIKDNDLNFYGSKRALELYIERLHHKIRGLDISNRILKKNALELTNQPQELEISTQKTIEDLQSQVAGLENLVAKITEENSDDKAALNERLQELQQSYQELESELEALNKENSNNFVQNLSLQSKLEEKEEELGLLEQEIAQLEENLELANFTSEEASLQREEALDFAEKFLADKTQTEEQNATLLQQIHSLKRQITDLTQEKEVLKAQLLLTPNLPPLPPLEPIEEEVTPTLIKTSETVTPTEEIDDTNDIDRIEKYKEGYELQISDLKTQLSDKEIDAEKIKTALKEQITTLKHSNISLNTRIEELQLEKSDIKSKLTTSDEANNNFSDRLVEVLRENENLKKSSTRKQAEITELTEQLQSSRQKINALAQVEEEYNAFLAAGKIALEKIESLEKRLQVALDNKDKAEKDLENLKQKINSAKDRLNATKGATNE